MDEPLFTRRFWLACGMHFSGAMALSFYILFPLFIRRLGGNELIIGLYAGLTGAAAVAARLPVGYWLDRQGRRRVLTAAGCLHVASWLGFLAINRLGMLSASLAVAYGLASGSLFAAYFTYASDITPITRRSEGIAMFGIWGMLPNGLGPLLGEIVIRRGSFHLYFGIAAACALVSLGITQFLPETVTLRRHARVQHAPSNAPLPWVELLPLLVTTLVFGAAVNGLFTFLAPFAQAQGGGSVGSFFMSYALTAVGVRLFTGRLPDRLGLRRVLIPALFLYAGGVLLVPYLSGHGLMLVGVMCGAGHGYAFPILNALTVQRSTAEQRGRAVSWFTAMFDLGNTLGSPTLGAVAEVAGYRAMFTAAGLGTLAAAVMWLRGSPRAPLGVQPGSGDDTQQQVDEEGQR